MVLVHMMLTRLVSVVGLVRLTTMATAYATQRGRVWANSTNVASAMDQEPFIPVDVTRLLWEIVIAMVTCLMLLASAVVGVYSIWMETDFVMRFQAALTRLRLTTICSRV